jgi:predicted GNAT family acetyltransferase
MAAIAALGQLFELADLDDAAWPQSEYYGLDSSAALAELCLLYRGLQLPNLVATVAHDEALMRELLKDVVEHLPSRFSAALSAGIAPALADRFRIEKEVPFLRMAVTDLHRIRSVDISGVEALTEEEESGVADFLVESFTNVRFESLAMRRRSFFGYKRSDGLLSVAGTTFFSAKYGVAVIGPVATRPDSRGQGLATRTTARLCLELASLGAEVIGLHVRAQNVPAIRCYERLGFAVTTAFHSYEMTER